MEPDVHLLDFECASQTLRAWWEQSQIPRVVPDDAVLVVGIGITWSETYYLSIDSAREYWVLWAQSGDDPFLVGQETYSVAWCDGKVSKDVAAQRMLRTYWETLRDLYGLRAEAPVAHGLLDLSQTLRLLDDIWGPTDSPSNQDGAP